MNKRYHMTEPEQTGNATHFTVELSDGLYDTAARERRELKIEGVTSVIPHPVRRSFTVFISRLYDADDVWLRLDEKLEKRAQLVEMWGRSLMEHAGQ